MMRRTISIIVSAVGLFMLYLLLWPDHCDLSPSAYPGAPGLTGVYAVNERLRSVTRLGTGAGVGPEGVAFDDPGWIYAGMADGRIMRFRPDGAGAQVFADTGGRPLGLRFDGAGNLIVCDAFKGVLSVSPDTTVTALITEVNGLPLKNADGLDIARDGTIYFTDILYKLDCRGKSLTEIRRFRPHGRLLSYDPLSRTVTILLDGLYFANGVAVSPDQSFILVAETTRCRVHRYWLAGPKTGQSEIFIDNLPGFPDGLSSNGEDTFWLPLVYPRDMMFDTCLTLPLSRTIVFRLPRFLFSGPRDYGFLLGLDSNGTVIHNLQDPSGAYVRITNIVERNGMLYLGSIKEDSIGVFPVPEM